MNRRRLLQFFGFATAAAVVPASAAVNPVRAYVVNRRCLTHVEYHDYLMRRATGWLGWTEQQALDATFPEIEDAISMKCAIINPTESIIRL